MLLLGLVHTAAVSRSTRGEWIEMDEREERHVMSKVSLHTGRVD